MNRETSGEKLQLQSEAVLLWPLWRRPRLRSLRQWSFGLPFSLFSNFRFLFHASVLFATLAVIYFLRTPCNTFPEVTSDYLVFIIHYCFWLFWKTVFFSFFGVLGGWCTTDPSMYSCIDFFTRLLYGTKFRITAVVCLYFPPLKYFRIFVGHDFSRINVLF